MKKYLSYLLSALLMLGLASCDNAAELSKQLEGKWTATYSEGDVECVEKVTFNSDGSFIEEKSLQSDGQAYDCTIGGKWSVKNGFLRLDYDLNTLKANEDVRENFASMYEEVKKQAKDADGYELKNVTADSFEQGTNDVGDIKYTRVK